MNDAQLAAEVVRLYLSLPSMTVRAVAMRLRSNRSLGARTQFVKRVLKSRGIGVRKVQRIAKKADRNDAIRELVKTTSISAVARRMGISRQRVTQIVRAEDRGVE